MNLVNILKGLDLTICGNLHALITFLLAICEQIIMWCEKLDRLSLLPTDS